MARRERRIPLRPSPEPDERPDRLRHDRLVHPDAPELLGEVERGLVPAVAVLFERGLDDDLQISSGTAAIRCARRSGGSFVRIAW